MLDRERDLAWLAEHGPTWSWRWARSYEDGAPHVYVVKHRALDSESYERLFEIIYEHGTLAKFYDRVNVELHLPDFEMPFGGGGPASRPTVRGFKFWPMTDRIEDSVVINAAPLSAVYGVQDAPSTEAPAVSTYDELAVGYDERYDRQHCEECQTENLAVWKHVMGDRHVPSLLDVGAGTGLALDLKMVREGHGEYRAVDPSRAMLNRLVYKHQWVRDVWPAAFEDYLEQHDGRTFDTVLSLFGSPSYIRPEAIGKMPDLVETMLVLMHYVPGYRPDYHTDETWPAWADESRQAAAELPGAKITRMNNFQIVTVR